MEAGRGAPIVTGMMWKLWFAACAAAVGCGNAPEEHVASAEATVVGRIQGTEFPTPSEAAAVWLASDGIGALRLSDETDGCGAPSGWSLLVQVNTDEANEYEIGLGVTDDAGAGFLAEYRREDGTLDMPGDATGLLTLTFTGEDYVAGSLTLETGGGAELTAVFEAPLCEATALINP